MPPTQQKTVDIEKLSPEAKAELLAQLQAEQKSEVDAIGEVRVEAMKTLMKDRDHKEGCPASRIEMYGATQPAKNDKPPKDVTVVHCQDCGGTSVLDQSYNETVERLESQISETEEVD